MRHDFPTLYLYDTKSGKVRFWSIYVISNHKSAYIHKKYGIKSGKIITPSPKIIHNSRTKSSYEKALKLANTQWQNRLRKGYSTKTSINNIKTQIKIVPMKAYPLESHKVYFPAYVQPKIDGYRALLHKFGNKYIFTSMTNRPYSHLTHIDIDIKKIKELNEKGIYLDGELYLKNLRMLKSILSSHNLNEEQKKEAKNIKFYVFDMFDLNKMEMTYEERYKILTNIFKKYKFKNIKLTPTTIVNNNKEIDKAFDKYVKEGHEGIIVRNKKGLYKLRGKSVDVLKSKNIKNNKFKIIGYKEAKGDNKGTVVWELSCKNNINKSFWARPMGSREERKKMYKHASKYIGKEVFVKYFELDKDGCVTKNPVVTKYI